MSIESLKQQARKHEQNEDWKKALDQYNKALAELAREEQVDIGLYNLVGDLYVRVGDLDAAVEHYDKAVELYREAYLPNNAIAVCKKIIRNVPARHRAYLLIGQIRAEQGFIPDARTNFLTYAERMAQDGDLDESFRALIEFCDLAPDDVGVRLSLADQMVASGRTEEAVQQLATVYRHHTQLGETSEAEAIEKRILEVDPEADIGALSAAPLAGGGGDEMLAGFGEIALDGDAFGSGSEEEISFAVGGAMEEAAGEGSDDGDDVDLGLQGFEIASDHSGAEDEDAVELPMMDMDDDGEDAVELPMMDLDDDDEDAVELPMMDLDDDGEDAVELPMMDMDDDEEGAVELPMMDMGDEDDLALPTTGMDAPPPADEEPTEDLGLTLEPETPVAEELSASIEFAVEDARSEGAHPPEPAPELTEPPAAEPVPSMPAPEPVVPQTPPEPAPPTEAADPVAPPAAAETPAAPPAEEAPDEPDGGYVDLGAMILGGGGEEEKSTRFTVAYEEPSGDEEADFARMLSQFKDKVSENLDTSDVRAHYDLGTAYKEMGLLDEAISSFQAALRASADHLPTYELMGQTFLEMGKPEAAVKSLERALQSGGTVEDDLVAIYYDLGRAYEVLQNRQSAVEYYDRVFSLDINFADVTERLRELR